MKKYDRFQWQDEIIEATGLILRDGLKLLHVFETIVPRPGRVKGEIAIYSEESFNYTPFTKVKTPTHSLIHKIAAEIKENPDFVEELIKHIVGFYIMSEDADKKKVFEVLEKYVDIETRVCFDTFCSGSDDTEEVDGPLMEEIRELIEVLPRKELTKKEEAWEKFTDHIGLFFKPEAG